jgi:hypothetical protein
MNAPGTKIGRDDNAETLRTQRQRRGADKVPPPRVFSEKRLQTIENKGNERKERPKRLRLAPVIALAFGFFCAPAFPVAILEGLGAFKSLERGGQLARGGQGRLALLFFAYLALVAAGVAAFIYAIMGLQDLFGNAWYIRPFPLLGFWGILLIPEWYMVVLTVNYFDQRLRKAESPLGTPAQPQT